MKTLITIATLTLALALGAFGQTTEPAAPAQIVALGGGFSQFSDPHYGMTATYGKHVGGWAFVTTSLDMGTKWVDGKRVSVSIVRPGLHKRAFQQGPLGVYISGDVGGVFGGGATVGQVSGGIYATYDIPKRPLAVYFGVRAIKSPQADPSLANPAILQTAASIGLIFKMQ
jgi:hypothetical protein